MNFKTENSTTPNGDWSQSKAFTNSGSSFPVLNGTCELDQENLALSNSGQPESIFTQDSGLHGIDVAAHWI